MTINLGKKTLEDVIGGLLDYIKNHVVASILIAIIIIAVITMMICICRKERKKGGSNIEINVNEVKGELVSKE